MDDLNQDLVEAVSDPAPIPATTPPKMSREDTLDIENLTLRVTNIALHERQLHQDLLRANETRRSLQEEIRRKQQSLSKKYGVDLSAPGVVITPEGVILQGAGTNAQVSSFDQLVNGSNPRS
jgi:uncharacterized protein (UPF0210 family)